MFPGYVQFGRNKKTVDPGTIATPQKDTAVPDGLDNDDVVGFICLSLTDVTR